MPRSAKIVRGALVVLGSMFSAAVRDGTIPANPVRRLEKGERPHVERREFPELDREAIGRLIASTPARYRPLLAMSVLTGIRQGEALGLRWDDIDVRAGVVRVRRQLDRGGQRVEPKTAAAKRDVPIPPSLARDAGGVTGSRHVTRPARTSSSSRRRAGRWIIGTSFVVVSTRRSPQPTCRT